MATVGFFTREDARTGGPKRTSTALTTERVRELGEQAVHMMNPSAKTRHMKPSGPKTRDVYDLGEAPGEKEDEQGKPFVGPSGQWIRERLPEGVRVRFNNCCRT